MGLAERWTAVGAEGRAEAVASVRERAGVPDLTAREVWGTRDPAAVKAILAEADADRARPWPQTLLSDYARFWRDGARTPYETPAGELRRRTSTAVVAAALTGDQTYVDEAADGLLLLCEQTTWCWAAHESFATERHEVLGDPDRPYLDLGAAETAEILAWADLVLGPALDDRVPGLRRRLRARGSASRRPAVPYRSPLALARPDRSPEQLEPVDPRACPRGSALPRGRPRGPTRGRRPRRRRPRQIPELAPGRRRLRRGLRLLVERARPPGPSPRPPRHHHQRRLRTLELYAARRTGPLSATDGPGPRLVRQRRRRLRPPGSQPALAPPAPLGPPSRRRRRDGPGCRASRPADRAGRRSWSSADRVHRRCLVGQCQGRSAAAALDLSRRASGAGRPRNGRHLERPRPLRSRVATTTRTTITTTSARSSRPSTAHRCSSTSAQPTYTALVLLRPPLRALGRPERLAQRPVDQRPGAAPRSAVPRDRGRRARRTRWHSSCPTRTRRRRAIGEWRAWRRARSGSPTSGTARPSSTSSSPVRRSITNPAGSASRPSPVGTFSSGGTPAPHAWRDEPWKTNSWKVSGARSCIGSSSPPTATPSSSP